MIARRLALGALLALSLARPAVAEPDKPEPPAKPGVTELSEADLELARWLDVLEQLDVLEDLECLELMPVLEDDHEP